ncbi:MAG: hypothetical protein EP349_01775 [Alphaproteobacteria bacterium]|nr:MAG: hypothetical protein EP349_01775 [Alphaproteobacteria bacterium]
MKKRKMLTTEERQSKRYESAYERRKLAEKLMWGLFVLLAVVSIVFVKSPEPVLNFLKAQQMPPTPVLVHYLVILIALILCFPPLHRDFLQRTFTPITDGLIRTGIAYVIIGGLVLYYYKFA